MIDFVGFILAFITVKIFLELFYDISMYDKVDLSQEGNLTVMFCQDLLFVCLGVSLSRVCTGSPGVVWEMSKK